MSFESFRNEVLLEIFKLLKSADVIRAFCCLNERFNDLLFSHMVENGVDFRSISKKNFEFICQKQLSKIATDITSLCLSDDDEAPYQSKLLLRNGFTLNQFKSLKSLSLYELRSDETWQAFMNGLSHLSELTDLKLIKCYVENVKFSCSTIMNAVWNLPNLTHCHFDIHFRNDMYLSTVKSRSSSLKHLTIENISCPLFELSDLFKCTQNLEYISLKSRDDHEQPRLPIMSSLTTLELHVEEHQHMITDLTSLLTTLELHVEKHQHMITNLLLATPNLRHLIVRSSSLHLNGQQWEAIISTHLLQLRVFQFKMHYSYYNSNHEQEMDQLLNSFRNRFWLEDHHWYVRCDCDCVPGFGTIEIYTIPYAFSDFFVSKTTLSGSTCPNADDYWSYDSVKTLHCDKFVGINNPVALQAHFPNVRHLSIKCSRTEDRVSPITNVNRLKSLKIMETCSPSFVQPLLTEATQLYSFSLSNYIIMLNNISIRRLDLLSECDYLTKDQCVELSHSSIMIRYEVLLIKVKDEMDILPLINNAHNLRALKIQCEKDYRSQNTSACGDAISNTLREHLPPTAEIDRDLKFRSYIRIWLR